MACAVNEICAKILFEKVSFAVLLRIWLISSITCTRKEKKSQITFLPQQKQNNLVVLSLLTHNLHLQISNSQKLKLYIHTPKHKCDYITKKHKR